MYTHTESKPRTCKLWSFHSTLSSSVSLLSYSLARHTLHVAARESLAMRDYSSNSAAVPGVINYILHS